MGGQEAEKTGLPEEPERKGAFSSVSSLCGYDEATGSGDTPCVGSVLHAQIPARVTCHTRQGHADTDQGRLGGGGPPRKRLYPGFHSGKWAVHAKLVQLESPQRTLRAVPCCWWQSEQTAQHVWS